MTPAIQFLKWRRRIKIEHVIVTALGSILLAQGPHKELGYFGQTLSEQCFDSQKDGNGVFSFVRR